MTAIGLELDSLNREAHELALLTELIKIATRLAAIERHLQPSAR